jgi:erythromycin esterase-like protein
MQFGRAVPFTRSASGLTSATAALSRAIEPLTGGPRDYDSLLDLTGDARFVLIGEASHGTHEFYEERVRITRRLIDEKDFGGVCIEGDWPDAHRVDTYVQGEGDDRDATQALEGFRRFPTWMWRNGIVRDFVEWLRARHEADRAHAVGFFGLDLYSLYGSIQALLAYLERVDPQGAQRARHRYGCFEHFGEDSQAYGYAVASDLADPCEEEAIRQLADLRAQALEYVNRDGLRAIDDYFSAEQNAQLIRDAEHYYRSMYRGRASSWNLRDRHMADTLGAVERHLIATGRSGKLVVWAHNSHLGDARFTDMRRRGELNLGQLARERYGNDAVRLIGFSTNTGTVTAAHDWDEPGRPMHVNPAIDRSYERLMADYSGQRGVPRFLVHLARADDATALLDTPRLQRAIGVIYRPETERVSHYYETRLPRQFDALIHIDRTSALRGLEPGEEWQRASEEPPDTFPSGI